MNNFNTDQEWVKEYQDNELFNCMEKTMQEIIEKPEEHIGIFKDGYIRFQTFDIFKKYHKHEKLRSMFILLMPIDKQNNIDDWKVLFVQLLKEVYVENEEKPLLSYWVDFEFPFINIKDFCLCFQMSDTDISYRHDKYILLSERIPSLNTSFGHYYEFIRDKKKMFDGDGFEKTYLDRCSKNECNPLKIRSLEFFPLY